MTNVSRLAVLIALCSAALLSACATQAPTHDYTAFINAKPASLLVLPPVNDSVEIKATPAVWAHATRPLAEAGYYVLPAALVDETFRQNGIQSANDAQAIPPSKLREYFGADAAVYLRIKDYGTKFLLLSSETRVVLEGRVMDLRSGEVLWRGDAAARSSDSSTSQQGLAGMLAAAIAKQVVGTMTDESFNYAGMANTQLLSAPRYNGILAGPRSPSHGQPPPSKEWWQ